MKTLKQIIEEKVDLSSIGITDQPQDTRTSGSTDYVSALKLGTAQPFKSVSKVRSSGAESKRKGAVGIWSVPGKGDEVLQYTIEVQPDKATTAKLSIDVSYLENDGALPDIGGTVFYGVVNAKDTNTLASEINKQVTLALDKRVVESLFKTFANLLREQRKRNNNLLI